ncbi:hypothetical protein BGW39_004629, partial [Mortierella sp. 14UC]
MSTSHSRTTSPVNRDPNATLVGLQQENDSDTPAQNNTQDNTPAPVVQHIDPFLARIEKRYIRICDELDLLDNIAPDITLQGPPRK